MLPSWNKSLTLKLSPELLTLNDGSQPEVKLPLQQADMGKALGSLLAQPQWRHYRLNVVLSNRLLRYAVLSLEAQLSDAQARQSYAEHQLTQLYGGAAGHWQVQLAELGENKVLVCGMERQLLEQLRSVSQANQLKLNSVMPLLAQVMNRQAKVLRRSSDWLVIHEHGFSTLLRLQQGRPVAISSSYHRDLSELPLMLDRENLSLGETAVTHAWVASDHPDEVRKLSTAGYAFRLLEPVANVGPSHQPLALDFQLRPVKPGWPAWALLLIGGALMGEMLASNYQLQQQLADALSVVQPVAASRPVSALDTAQQQRQQQMMQRLQQPWQAFFEALEGVQNQDVAILSMQHQPDNDRFYLQGEARDYPALLSLVAELNWLPPFADASLSFHQIKTRQPGQPVAFELTMRWVQP